MKTYFVISDIHGFYNITINALNKKGFDINNKSHIVIICGDAFDRGTEASKVYLFIKQLKEKNRLIYIRGNHEDLLFDCVKELKKYNGAASSHHYSNGTVNTIVQFMENDIDINEVLDFINNNSVDYYELNNYIFVHGWIPVITNDKLPIYYSMNRNFTFNPNWRKANKHDWEQARWLNGMEMANRNFIEKDKIIVCGHWHTGYGHFNIHHKGEDEFSKYSIYKDKGIIALDACTVKTNKINVLKLID